MKIKNADKKALLEFKRIKKRKNPVFKRQDYHKKKRIGKVWRKPRGYQSKQRLRRNGRVIVSPGYGTPAKLRHFNVDGLEIVHVSKLEDVQNLNSSSHCCIVSRKLGFRKKKPLIEELTKLGFKLINIRADYVQEMEQKLLERKQEKKIKEKELAEKEKKIDEKDKKTESKVKKPELTDEEKKKADKKEIDKILTRKT